MGVDMSVDGERRRRDGGLRRVGRALLVVVAVVVSVLAVQATPVRASVGAEAPGGWEWPLAGPPPVTRGFSPPAEQYGRGHRGVDLGASPGAVVVAAGAGRVSYAGLLAGRGVVVVVHGDLRTTYEPVTAEVALGQQVVAGQPLGRLAAGHQGCAAAACLHWGLRRGEQYLDPLMLVGAGPVRLLPLESAGSGPAGVASSGRAAPATVDQRLPVSPPPAQAPPFDLRAAVSPSGALAVLALVAGLALLVRPRPPSAPAGGASAAAGQSAEDPPVADGPTADVLDLDHQRLIRRTGAP